MTTEQAFLADIYANPDDDTPRLVFADWLTERDGPGDSMRAEFIRGQIEIARLCQDPTRPWTDFRLLERHRSLTSAVDHGNYPFLVPDWTGTPPGEWSWYAEESQIVVECGNSPTHYPFVLHWQRGFIEHVTLKADDWCRYAERLLATQPIREVTLTTRLRVRVRVGPDPSGDWVTFHPGHLDEPVFALRPGMSWVEQLPWAHSQADQARWLWPGITFHGPDFPEVSA